MNISQYGDKCHICNKKSNFNIRCTIGNADHYNCTSGCDKNKHYSDNNHIVCYKCTIYCQYCGRNYCTICERNNHNTTKCYKCNNLSCNTTDCDTCDKSTCNNCKKQEYDDKCVTCNKSWNNYVTLYIDDYCYDCTENLKPSCDICGIQKCVCSINWRRFRYTKENIVQLLKLCENCEHDNNLLVKSRYLLALYPFDLGIPRYRYIRTRDINEVIRTLLLIANSRNKYINKPCFIYKIIPEIINYYVEINSENIYNTDETLYKCTMCLKYVTRQDVKKKTFVNYNGFICTSC